MPTSDSAHPDLSGLRVLVTRPALQAERFVQLLQNAGAQTFELPCINIVYLNDKTLSPVEKNKSLHSDWWIFTSANAVIGASECGLWPAIGTAPKIAAIGQATSRSLKKHHIPTDLAPTENSNSEQLLALIKQQIKAGDKITIIRGDSGREVLKDSLQSLGAEVHYLQVYQRRLPDLSATQAEKILLQAMPCVISITSDLGLTNLLQLIPAPARAQLLNCPLLVNSERCANLATSSGFHQQIKVARPPGDQGQLVALSGFS